MLGLPLLPAPAPAWPSLLSRLLLVLSQSEPQPPLPLQCAGARAAAGRLCFELRALLLPLPWLLLPLCASGWLKDEALPSRPWCSLLPLSRPLLHRLPLLPQGRLLLPLLPQGRLLLPLLLRLLRGLPSRPAGLLRALPSLLVLPRLWWVRFDACGAGIATAASA